MGFWKRFSCGHNTSAAPYLNLWVEVDRESVMEKKGDTFMNFDKITYVCKSCGAKETGKEFKGLVK